MNFLIGSLITDNGMSIDPEYVQALRSILKAIW